MGTKRHKPEEIVTKLRQVEVHAPAGQWTDPVFGSGPGIVTMSGHMTLSITE